ncbi:MAG: HAD-IC family P-type ATPase, partial [Candidatus Spechtbacterales bacterium]|nr:HAD-IC family P-type ATPase [Candidatus Spechtbacterales bacterium]
RQRSFGLNQLPRGKKVHWYEMLWRQFKNPLIFILLIAVAFTYWIGLQEAESGHGTALEHYADTIVISLAVLINIVIGFWQEFRSNNLFEKLEKLVTIKARIRRDGQLHEVDSKELVPGDIILLKVGMKVPADARIINSKGLEANEALLTGESMPVKKQATDKLEEGTDLAERKNMVHTGTVISKGEGEAVVVSTGKDTELGKIAELTASVEEEETPLQKRLGGLGKKISWAVTFFAILIVLIGLFEKSGNLTELARQDVIEMFTLAVAVAVAAIPEGLPAAMSIVLAVASQRILKTKGLVKTLLGAEILGSTTVICTDKTGTLTEGKMKVKEVKHTDKAHDAALAMALANEAVIIEGNEVSGEATDRAKLEYFMENGGDINKILKEMPRVNMLPFDATEKYIASVHKSGDEVKIFISGAPEKLLELSTKTKSEKEKLKGEIEELAGSGYRLIASAELTLSGNTKVDLEDDSAVRKAVKNIEYTGTAVIGDPIREDVEESLASARQAGIRIIMITGDHKLTARYIGGELGFRNNEEAILEGSELDKMSAEELAEKIKDVDIISRASPRHKMQIIEALRLNEEVVAMTGDGVNDAPALKNADIGVALGAGTDVTKEASDLVLMNDSFTTISEAIKQGRIAFDNIRKVSIFVISNAFTEIMLILTALIGRMEFLPITAVQILWANLVEGGFPSAALAFEPGEEDIMDRKPFKRKEPILNKLGMYIIGVVGILSNLILVGLFLWLVWADYPQQYVQTVIFAAVATDTLIYVFSIKRLHQSIFHSSFFNNKYLLIGVIVGIGLMFASVYVPSLNTLLGTVPLDLLGISLALGSGIMRLLFIEFVKWIMRKRGAFHKMREEATA